MKSKWQLLPLALLMLTQACKKDADPDPAPPANIWVDSRYGDNINRQYFQGGQSTKIDYKVRGDMFVNGIDVYYGSVGGYRKNGVLVQLPDAKEITALCVRNGIVYATGVNFADDKCYWVGAQLHVLQEPEFKHALGMSHIFVDDQGQVHLAGNLYYGEPDSRNEIFHWTNNTLTMIPYSTILDFTMSGTDVHMVGYSADVSLSGYWVNNIRRNLYDAEGKVARELDHVSVWGNDVYITAAHEGVLYWKNGEAHDTVSSDIHPVGVVVANGQVTVAMNRAPKHGPNNKDYFMELRTGNHVQSLGDGVILSVRTSN